MSAIDLLVSELLASRICHDLVGPVGAVNAGVELLEEGGVDKEALGLLGRSAAQAQQRLQLYRFAFGRGGERQDFTTLQSAAEAALGREGKVTFDWAEASTVAKTPGLGRVVVNALILLSEALPHGGIVRLMRPSENVRIAISAEGKRAILRPDLAEAVLGQTPEDQLTARTIQAYLTHLIALRAGMRWDIVAEGDQLLRADLLEIATESKGF